MNFSHKIDQVLNELSRTREQQDKANKRHYERRKENPQLARKQQKRKQSTRHGKNIDAAKHAAQRDEKRGTFPDGTPTPSKPSACPECGQSNYPEGHPLSGKPLKMVKSHYKGHDKSNYHTWRYICSSCHAKQDNNQPGQSTHKGPIRQPGNDDKEGGPKKESKTYRKKLIKSFHQMPIITVEDNDYRVVATDLYGYQWGYQVGKTRTASVRKLLCCTNKKKPCFLIQNQKTSEIIGLGILKFGILVESADQTQKVRIEYKNLLNGQNNQVELEPTSKVIIVNNLTRKFRRHLQKGVEELVLKENLTQIEQISEGLEDPEDLFSTINQTKLLNEAKSSDQIIQKIANDLI